MYRIIWEIFRPSPEFVLMFHLLAGWGSTPTQVTVATVTSGPAPLLVVTDVFSDADIPLPPVNDTGDPDPGAWWYGWHYGDDDEALWATTGKTKNWSTGPTGAHVYETPGTYVIILRIKDENDIFSTYQQTITVTDPEVVYSGATFYVAPTGNDSNDGSSGSPWLTAEKALGTSGLFAANGARRVLFQRGGTYARAAGSTISSKTGPYHIGAYGTGADPIINLSSGISGLLMASTVSGVRMVDVDITGTGGSENGVQPGVDCLFLRMGLNSVSSGFTNSNNLRSGNGIVECSVGSTIGQYTVYSDASYHLAVLGSTLDSGGVSGEYVLRVYSSSSVFSHNDFRRGGTTGKGYGRWAGFFPTGDPNRGGYEPTETAEYNVVSDNLGSTPSTGNTYMFQFGVVNTGDARIWQNGLVERNRITAASTASNCMECDSARGTTFRNNVGIVTDAPAAELLRITRSGAGSVVPIGNRALNNTTICNTTYTGNGIQIGTVPENTLIQNNAVFSTSATCGDADGVADSAAGGETTITSNAVYAITQLDDIATGEPIVGATCLNAGTASIYVVDDFGNPGLRFTTRNDQGAWESGTPTDEWGWLIDSTPAESTPLGALMGVNIDKLRFSGVRIFKDLFKQSGHTGTGALVPWLARDSGTFGTNGTSVTAMTDATGYPDVDLPYDAGGGEGPAILETRMATLGDYEAGTYTVYWDGTATIGIAGDATASLTASGQTFTVTTPSTTGITLRILTTSGTRITNIRVVHSTFLSDYLTDPFHPTAIERLASFAREGTPLIIRTFELSRTNGSRDGGTNAPDIVVWGDRTTTTWASQATSNGVAWEYIFRLCNAVSDYTGEGCYPWVCVHHQSDDTYQTQLATLALSELDNTQEVIIQWSNEASFNGNFDQCTFTRTQGSIFSSGSTAEKGNKYYCKEAAAFFGRWFDAWTGTEDDRVHTALDTQASSVTVTARLLDYYGAATVDGVSVNPDAVRLDIMSFAPYCGLNTDSGNRFGADLLNNQIPGMTLATATYAQGISTIRASYMPISFTFIEDQVGEITDRGAETDMPYTGVQAAFYEFGPNITSGDTGEQADTDLTTYLSGLSDYSGMYELMLEYLEGCDERLQGPMCWFTFGAPYSGANMYGAFQSFDYELADAPKWRAIAGYATGVRAGQGSSRSTFRHPMVRWSIRRLK